MSRYSELEKRIYNLERKVGGKHERKGIELFEDRKSYPRSFVFGLIEVVQALADKAGLVWEPTKPGRIKSNDDD